jgi:hypothetical protein
MKKLEIELVKIFDTGLAMRVIHQKDWTIEEYKEGGK